MGQIGKYLNGRAFKEADWKTTGRPIIRIQNLTGSGKSFNYFQGEVEPRYLVKEGDLLFSWAATLGTFIWHGPEAVLNQHIFKVESSINPKFHRYLLEYSIQEMRSKTHGSGMVHITKSKFDKIEVPVPPLDEQTRIVETLDDHLSRLDKALADLDHADQQTLVFRRSILNALLNPNASGSEPGVERVSELPLGWEAKSLGEVAETQLGKMLNRSQQVGDSTIPYLRNVNVQWGRIDLSDVKEMDIYPEERSKFTAVPGDLLVCEGGESGRAAIWNGSEPIGIQNAIHRIRPKADLDVRYLLYYFEWQVKSRMIDHLLSGVTITHFTQEKLRRMEIQYPPIDEQRRIVETLDDHLSRLDSTQKSIASQKLRLASLRRSILNKAFIGELGTN